MQFDRENKTKLARVEGDGMGNRWKRRRRYESIGVSGTGGQGASIGKGLTGTGHRQVKRTNIQRCRKMRIALTEEK